MKSFEVKGKVWRYQGEGAWHFVYVPKDLSQRIKDATRNKKKVGFHFVKVKATIGTYLIAIKADVRHKENIAEGDAVKIDCKLL